MAKKQDVPQVEMFDKDSLKMRQREEDKFPPLEEAELRQLKKIWSRSLAETRHPHRIPPPYAPEYPGARSGGIAARAFRMRETAGRQPENQEHTRRSQGYWASYRKCAACPGPHRRQGKFPFGQGPNVGHTPDGEPT